MKLSMQSSREMRPRPSSRTGVHLYLAILLTSLVLYTSPFSRSAYADPPYIFDLDTYDGYIFPGLGEKWVPVPDKPVIAGARLYSFPGVTNSLGFWQDCDVKKMLPGDRALGTENPDVFFFGTHGRMKIAESAILQGLNAGGCKYGFATSCNEISRGMVHTATEMARQSGKICFGINPDIDASMHITFDAHGRPVINIEEILPDGSDGPLLGPGTKQKATVVAVRPDGTVVQVPHPERLPHLKNATFNFNNPESTSTPETRRGGRCSTNTMMNSRRPPGKGIRGGKLAGTVASLGISAYLGNRASQGDAQAASIVEGMAYHDTIVSNLQRGCDANGERVGWWQGWFNALGASATDCFGP